MIELSEKEIEISKYILNESGKLVLLMDKFGTDCGDELMKLYEKGIVDSISYELSLTKVGVKIVKDLL